MKGIIYVNDFGICVIDTKLEDFFVKQGMVVVPNDMVRKIFKRSVDSELIGKHSVLSYKYCNGSYLLWVKSKSDTFWHTECVDLKEDCKDISETELDVVLTTSKEILSLVNSKLKFKPQNLFTGDGFRVTLVEAGELCNNGGGYGFYMEFRKTDVEGLYEVSSYATCDFDNCGTGFECYTWLTNEYAKKYKEDSVEAVKYLKTPTRLTIIPKVIKEHLKDVFS